MHHYDEFLNFANLLADESEIIINKYFRTKINISEKNDKSPVTIADQNTELKIRELIKEKYPSHGILGEEFEQTNINSEFIWVIDPIDGTRSFIAGHKDFGTLISLLHNKKPIIGIINCPAHNERWIGVKGRRTTMNGKEVQTSKIKDLKSENWINLYIHWELSLIKELGFETVVKENFSEDTKKALSFNRNLLMENFIIPNRLKFPLFRNILENYFL